MREKKISKFVVCEGNVNLLRESKVQRVYKSPIRRSDWKQKLMELSVCSCPVKRTQENTTKYM
jgi:hypothetical protein